MVHRNRFLLRLISSELRKMKQWEQLPTNRFY